MGQIHNLLRESATPVQAQAALIQDPRLKPRVSQGTVMLEVLSNMLYLEGRFHNAGARLRCGVDEAGEAVTAGYARYLTQGSAA